MSALQNMTNLVSMITAIHLAALSQIESGDRDDAVGPQGEVSRFQILPKIWNGESGIGSGVSGSNHRPKTQAPGSRPNPQDPAAAAAVARRIWDRRAAVFCLAYGRPPTLRELYLCWHRPGRVLLPYPAEADRAERFANIFQDLQKETKVTKRQIS